MSTDIDVPAIGNVKKQYVYAGVALVIGVVGYAWFRRRASAASSSATTPGVGSASPDAFQGAALPMGSYDAYGNLAANQTTTQDPAAPWALRAVDYLANAFGYDKQAAAMAITHFLSGQTLTPAEADLVNLARNVVGPDPSNLAVKVGPAPPTPPSTNPDPPPPPPSNNQPPPVDHSGMGQLWDEWQAQQVNAGLYKSDPSGQGGLDWGVIARQTLGPSATRVEVLNRAMQMQSMNQDAHTRYPFYVPQNVIPTLRHP